MKRRSGGPGRGGIVDLALVVTVVVAAWGRTPVGGLFDRAWQWASGAEGELPALTAFFVTGPPPEIVVLAEKIGILPDVAPVPTGGLPEPWRTAARLTLDADDAMLAALDAAYDGDAEAALETVVVGEELRRRAIERAIAAGEAEPERFASHRAYLPDRDARRADRLVSGTLALATVLELTWPLAVPHRVSSPYGERIHPVLGVRKKHDGVDLAVPEGTPVLAAQAGRVAAARFDRVSGNYVVIDHGHGVKTSYCHLSSLGVDKGAEIDRGAVLGASGNTGRSTGPHVHFTVRVGRATVDPLRLAPKDAPITGVPAAADAVGG